MEVIAFQNTRRSSYMLGMNNLTDRTQEEVQSTTANKLRFLEYQSEPADVKVNCIKRHNHRCSHTPILRLALVEESDAG